MNSSSGGFSRTTLSLLLALSSPVNTRVLDPFCVDAAEGNKSARLHGDGMLLALSLPDICCLPPSLRNPGRAASLACSLSNGGPWARGALVASDLLSADLSQRSGPFKPAFLSSLITRRGRRGAGVKRRRDWVSSRAVC